MQWDDATSIQLYYTILICGHVFQPLRGHLQAV